MIQARFVGDRIVSSSRDAFLMYEKSRFGEKEGNEITYAGVEVLYLLRLGKLVLHSGSKSMSEDFLLRKLRKHDPSIATNFAVFRDLRKRGYIVKTALKFGTQFRVYEKGVKPGEDHAKWLVAAVKESDRFDWHDFAAKNRVAHSARKHLLLGIVDVESDVTYYEVSWIKP